MMSSFFSFFVFFAVQTLQQSHQLLIRMMGFLTLYLLIGSIIIEPCVSYCVFSNFNCKPSMILRSSVHNTVSTKSVDVSTVTCYFKMKYNEICFHFHFHYIGSSKRYEISESSSYRAGSIRIGIWHDELRRSSVQINVIFLVRSSNKGIWH